MERSGSEFLIEKQIGSGVYGEVFVARDQSNGSRVALKRITKKPGASSPRETYLKEIKAGQMLNHPGIIQLQGHFESSRHYWLVFEYLSGGDLVNFMEARNFQPVPENQAKQLFKQILDAVAYSHSQGVAHLDLKLDNILIGANNRLKLIDFGLSSFEASTEVKRVVGSPEYAAPEIFKDSNSSYSGFVADIWSLGIVLYALLFGQFPFDGETLYCMRKGFATELAFLENVHVSDSAKDLLRKMLAVDPKERITLEEIQNHKWLLSASLATVIRSSSFTR